MTGFLKYPITNGDYPPVTPYLSRLGNPPPGGRGINQTVISKSFGFWIPATNPIGIKMLEPCC